MSGVLLQAFIYLCAAVIAVPIARRLGLGSVLGYLIAGIIIGPVLGLVGSETADIRHFAELGVVMMLFLIGLELKPQLLWEMRTRLLGLGGMQVGVTTALIFTATFLLGVNWRIAIAIGLIFSLSSTAIVLQTLSEKGLTITEGGRTCFSVLLFQDIAIIPMLALIPLLAIPELAGSGLESLGHITSTEVAGATHQAAHTGFAEGLRGWTYALMVLGTVALVVLGGNFLSRPLFRFIAKSRLREIFTASALLLIIGITLLMTLLDLSPALGTFLAGVVLANSEFRHELESDIEPFKGLLLGLFFITVGAGIDFGVLSDDLALVLGLTLAMMVTKGLVLFILARLFHLDSHDGWLITLGLAQAGEFGFVLLSFSVQNDVIPGELAKLLSLIVALSMLLTPILFILHDKIFLSRRGTDEIHAADTIDQQGTVVIAGMGRFGEIVNRLLVAAEVRTVVLDHDASIIDMLRKIGVKSYYGDASRGDLLKAAGIEHAKALIVAIGDRVRAVEIVEYVRRHYPNVKIFARAYDVNHLYLLKNAGADMAVREVFDGSVKLGAEVLKELGAHPFKVRKMVHAFDQHDEAGLVHLYELWDENPDIAKNRAYLSRAKEHGETLKEMMEADRMQLHDRTERAWTPPPKGYNDDHN